MTYKISSLPSPRALLEEKADFWEVESIREQGQFISQMNVLRVLSRGVDEINHDGIESDEDSIELNLDDVFQQLIDRKAFCSIGYPFEFGHSSIRFDETSSYKRDVYLFLLLCTRFNMTSQKIQNGIDATLLFEKLSAEVAKNFFGYNAESLVFGTAALASFPNKIKDLVISMGEGYGYQNPNLNYPTKNDDGIDVVVWKNFSDGRIGKLIGFGQCKTGTNWKDSIHKLKPRDFCDNWLSQSPVLDPIPMIFICDTLNYEQNFYTDQKGFLVFNRFRIMEYLPNELEDFQILVDIQTWLSGALEIL